MHWLKGRPSQELDVVLASDRRGVIGLVVAVRSALARCSVPLNVHILCAGLTGREKSRLERSWHLPMLGGVRFYDMADRAVRGFKTTRYHRSPITYARFYIASLLKDVHRCVYYDIDTIIFDDLAALAATDLSTATVAAVRELADLRDAEIRAKRLGLADARNYFNAGVMVINLDRWRERNVERQLLKVATEAYDRIVAVDQDVLNLVLQGQLQFLDSKWNQLHWGVDPRSATGIAHCMGPVKPWHPGHEGPLRDYFFGILDETAFAGWRPRDWGGLLFHADAILRKLPTRAMIVEEPRRRIGHVLHKVMHRGSMKLSRLGERLGWDWLTYNRGITRWFWRIAKANAPLFADVVQKTFPTIKSVADIGCGSGGYLAEFQRRGLRVMGCEYSSRARRWAANEGVPVVGFDLSKGWQPLPDAPFDLCMSLEVAEHVPCRYADELVQLMVAASSLIVFSAAHPGQGGAVGHINERPKEYWIEKFEAVGCQLDLAVTTNLATEFRTVHAVQFTSDNIMVFRVLHRQGDSLAESVQCRAIES